LGLDLLIQRRRFFTKWPQSLPYRVAVEFGKPLDADHADIATVREELLKLGESCYSHRPVLRQHLAYACLRGMKRGPFGTAIIDGLDHSTLSRGKLLGVANCARAASPPTLPGAADRGRVTAGKRRRGRESRGDARGQDPGEL
jgi:hypothetical protein